MDYESFKEQFVEDVKDRLYEQGAEVNVTVHEVNKLNESYEAITVTPEGSNIGVNIGIDKFYDAIENGREQVAQEVGESRGQLHRYLRLVELIPPILELVDKKALALATAVEVSFLDHVVQQMLYEYMCENEICKTFQIFALRDYLKENDTITKMELMRILNENAPKDESNRFQQLTITKKKLQEYFPTFYTKSQMGKILFDLLADWKRNQEEEG